MTPTRGPSLPSDDRSTVGPGGPAGDAGEAGEADPLEAALGRARDALLGLQESDGHWCAELEGDSILESEYILTMYYLGRGAEPRVRKAGNQLLVTQLPAGGWSAFPGGDPEVSATVKAYFALKLLGEDPESEAMRRARDQARRLGGLRACNSYTKIYLAIFGQYPWRLCPAVPPEMVLLSRHLPFSLYALSAWSRAIVVPLSIIWAYKPSCEIPRTAAIGELDVDGSARHRARARTYLEEGWSSFFEAVDLGIKWIEQLGLRPFRQTALDRSEEWILARLDKSDGLGAIFPPIINSIIAFTCRGYSTDHPTVAAQIDELERLTIEEGDTLRVEPCKSPVWDTSQALNALLEGGADAGAPEMVSAAAWLLEREVTEPGDCQIVDPSVPLGGWYFEYANEFYPDCDDTAEVMTALSRVVFPDEVSERRAAAALSRGVDWLLAMQNADGGWASFDRGCDREVLTFIPFADHNAMIDPSTVDITSRAVEALVRCGIDRSDPAIGRGVGFILDKQEADGSWYGRWGANYLYGTWLALSGLAAAGFDMSDPSCRRAVDWLLVHQNTDGGWGESLRSYEEPGWKGRGESTASQTAWAIHGLIQAGEWSHEAVGRGLEYLLTTQAADGTWSDASWTGTGFPGVFYLNYHYYATYFPLLTLGAYRDAVRAARAERVA